MSTAALAATTMLLASCGDSTTTVTLGALAAEGATEFEVVMTIDDEEVFSATSSEMIEQEFSVSGEFSISVEVTNLSDVGIVRCGIDGLFPMPTAGNGEASVNCVTNGSISGDSISGRNNVIPVARDDQSPTD